MQVFWWMFDRKWRKCVINRTYRPERITEGPKQVCSWSAAPSLLLVKYCCVAAHMRPVALCLKLRSLPACTRKYRNSLAVPHYFDNFKHLNCYSNWIRALIPQELLHFGAPWVCFLWRLHHQFVINIRSLEADASLVCGTTFTKRYIVFGFLPCFSPAIMPQFRYILYVAVDRFQQADFLEPWFYCQRALLHLTIRWQRPYPAVK